MSLCSCFRPRRSPRVLTTTSSSSMATSDARAAADRFLTVLLTAATAGPALDKQLDDAVRATSAPDRVTPQGWTEHLAESILAGLAAALQDGQKLGAAVVDVLAKVEKAAEGFAREHPVYCTLIAIGVLFLLAPWVLEVLGFAELGPVEGSFAAWWQSTYAGYVPKGSLFSFFQRLGMLL